MCMGRAEIVFLHDLCALKSMLLLSVRLKVNCPVILFSFNAITKKKKNVNPEVFFFNLKVLRRY